MTLRYASRDCVHEKKTHLGLRPQLQTQRVFFELGVIVTEKDSSDIISFTNTTKFGYLKGNSRSSYLHMW